MSISLKGKTLHMDMAASLPELAEAQGLQPMLSDAARREQQAASDQAVVPGLLAAGGASLLATAMLALDAELELQDGATQGYGHWLALRATAGEPKVAGLHFSTAARLDSYLADGVWLAVARWPAGRTRVAIGGWGPAPLLAMDGREPSGILEAAENTLMLAGNGEIEDEARLETVRQLAQQASR